MNSRQFEDITMWQDKTFPASTDVSRIKHLKKEVDELLIEVEKKEKDFEELAMEYADCFFLLFGAAKKSGMSYDGICAAIHAKFEINKNRSWGEPDNDGIVEHI